MFFVAFFGLEMQSYGDECFRSYGFDTDMEMDMNGGVEGQTIGKTKSSKYKLSIYFRQDISYVVLKQNTLINRYP